MKNKSGLALVPVFLLWFLSGTMAYCADNPGDDPAKQASGIQPAGTIRVLAPPDSMMIEPDETEAQFGDFVFEDDAFDEPAVSLTSRTLYEYHNITGPGRQASFLDEGGHVMTDLELRTLGSWGSRWNTELNSMVRLTQSRRYDPEDFSVQYLQFTASDATNRITLGDYYASLSQYSLNRGIKGLGYQKTFGRHKYVRVVGGSFHARWDHLFERNQQEPVDRNVVGVRGQYGEDNYFLGLNLVTAWDRDGDPGRTLETTYRQILPSVDWEYRARGLRLSGEHAYAPTRKQATPDRDNERITGTANRVNAHASLGKLRLRARTEHVTPDFVTMGGGAALDRFRVFVRGDYRLTRTWSLYAGTDWYRNNLESQLEATTKTFIPEAGVRARGLFDRRSLSVSSGVRRRVVSTESPDRRRNITDRLTFGVGDRFGDVSVRGAVEVLINEDQKAEPRTKKEDYLYRLMIDSRHVIMGGSVDLRPYLTLERQEIEDPATGRPVRTHSACFDLRALTGNDWRFGLNLEARSIRSNIADRDDSDETRFAVNAEKTLRFFSDVLIRGEAGQNRYRFSDSRRNYRESFVLVSLDLMFNKGN